jgi:glutamyl-tRNA(Gln) amidotransferase subunit E
MEQVRPADYLAILGAVEEGRVAKEAIPDILTATASGTPALQAIAARESAMTPGELARIIRRILGEREAFVREKKMAALGPLMGVVMQEVRGKVDGKVVSESLKRELAAFLREKARD